MPAPVQTRLMAILRQIMDERGYSSRRELARAAGVSQGTVENIVHGRYPKATTLVTMERELGLHRSELLIAAGYVPEPVDIRPKAARILSIFESLTPDKADDMLQYAQYLLHTMIAEQARRRNR